MPQLEIATICMRDAGNVLIGRQRNGSDVGKWAIPSGFVMDGERMIETSERVMIEETGIVVKPKQILFPCEVLQPTHRTVLFCLAEYVSGEPSPGASLIEVRFVDPRTLGDYQKEGMAELTEDAFFKFSVLLKNQASAQTSGTV